MRAYGDLFRAPAWKVVATVVLSTVLGTLTFSYLLYQAGHVQLDWFFGASAPQAGLLAAITTTISGAVAGGVAALCQHVTLRRSARWSTAWQVATVAAWTTGACLAGFLNWVFTGGLVVYNVAMFTYVAQAAGLTTLGVGQWWVLRKRVRNAWSWVGATIFGWVLAGVVAWVLAEQLSSMFGADPPSAGAFPLPFWLVVSAIAGGITGLRLVTLIKSPWRRDTG